jgi:hypothetical protein
MVLINVRVISPSLRIDNTSLVLIGIATVTPLAAFLPIKRTKLDCVAAFLIFEVIVGAPPSSASSPADRGAGEFSASQLAPVAGGIFNERSSGKTSLQGQ